MTERILSVLLCALFLPLIGCVAMERYYPFQGSGKMELEGGRILVEPIRSYGGMSREFNRGVVEVRKEIILRLEKAGYRVLSEDETFKALEGLDPVGRNNFSPATGRLDPARVRENRRVYLNKLAERDACDLVVSSGVYFRGVEYLGFSARWDGVVRNIRYDIIRMGAGSIKVTGYGADHGLSVGLSVRTLSGELVHGSYGGLDLYHAVGLSLDKRYTHFEPRRNPLGEKRFVREAVDLALHPFVVYPHYPEEPKFEDQAGVENEFLL